MFARIKKQLKGITSLLLKALPPPSETLLRELSSRPAIKINIPRTALGLIEEGRAKLSQKKFSAAERAFLSALEQNTEAAWAWHGLGDLYQLQGEYEAALESYTKATIFSPNEGIHHAGCSNALESLGQLAEAETSWRKALTLDSSLSWIRSDRS